MAAKGPAKAAPVVEYFGFLIAEIVLTKIIIISIVKTACKRKIRFG